MSKTETDLLKLALIDDKYANGLRQREEQVFTSQMAIAIFEALNKCDNGTRPIDENRVIEVLDQEMVPGFEKVVAQVVPEGSEDKMYRDCLKSIKRTNLEREQKLLIDSLDLADEEENQEEIIELTRKLMEIQREIEMIKRG